MPDASELAIAPFERPSAGYSNETFLFDLSYRLGDGVHRDRLVARLAPSDFLVFPEYDLVAQCRVMRSLAATTIPVPRVRWLEEDATVLGTPFYLMDAIGGEVPAEVPSYHSYGFVSEATPERRTHMWWSGIGTLARIHALDWRTLGLAFLGVPPPETGPLDRQLVGRPLGSAYLRQEGGGRPPERRCVHRTNRLPGGARLAPEEPLRPRARDALLG